MYAIINTGGKQYKVEQGDEIVVERIHNEENAVRPIMIVVNDMAIAKSITLLKSIRSLHNSRFNKFIVWRDNVKEKRCWFR